MINTNIMQAEFGLVASDSGETPELTENSTLAQA